METKKTELVAACGLYCGACGRYKKGRCAGCRDNVKATWCGIRRCCTEKNYNSCAECTEFTDLKKCKKFNNIPGKIIGFLTGSDRFACIYRIKEIGYEPFVIEMDSKGLQAIKKTKR